MDGGVFSAPCVGTERIDRRETNTAYFVEIGAGIAMFADDIATENDRQRWSGSGSAS